jgi:hypothetical protein
MLGLQHAQRVGAAGPVTAAMDGRNAGVGRATMPLLLLLLLFGTRRDEATKRRRLEPRSG